MEVYEWEVKQGVRGWDGKASAIGCVCGWGLGLGVELGLAPRN